MKALTLIFVVYTLTLTTLPAQTTRSATTPKSKALVAAEAQLAAAQDQIAELEKTRDNLSKENTELQKRYDGAMTILAALRTVTQGGSYTNEQLAKFKEMSGSDAIVAGSQIEANLNNIGKMWKDLADHDAAAVAQYNSLLSQYQSYVNQVNLQFAQIGQANRVANALAIYQMFQRYTPPQTINVNVTNCTVFPSLCLH